jgi:hypothetical protein
MAWTTPPTYATGFANRMTAAIANAQLRDNLNYLYRSFARKSADEPVISSTVLQDDNHLFLPMLASETWTWEGFILYDGATTADLKIAFTVPAGATGAWGVVGADVTTTTSLNVTSFGAYGDANTISLGALGAGTLACAFVQGTVIMSGTAGNLQLRWAQVASIATNTNIFTNSWLLGYRHTT